MTTSEKLAKSWIDNHEDWEIRDCTMDSKKDKSISIWIENAGYADMEIHPSGHDYDQKNLLRAALKVSALNKVSEKEDRISYEEFIKEFNLKKSTRNKVIGLISLILITIISALLYFYI